VSADTGRFEFESLNGNFTVYSETADLPRGPAPITVAVEAIEFDLGPGLVTGDFPPPNQPQQRQWPNVSLTVYYVEDGNRFRVAVTNLSAIFILRLTVRWWRMDV
jgi:hypothetical protein